MSFADRRRWPRFPQRADRRLPARAAHRRMTPPEVSARRSRSAGSSRFRCGARTTTSPTSGDGRSTGQARFASSPGRAGHSRGQCEADAEATRPPDGARDDPAARRPYQLIEYTSVQRGLPTARHERHFVEDHASFGYRIVVEFEPRTGLRRPFDRVVVARAVERVAGRTVRNLEQRFAELSARDDERPMGVRSR
jgi:hypothetical protein